MFILTCNTTLITGPNNVSRLKSKPEDKFDIMVSNNPVLLHNLVNLQYRMAMSGSYDFTSMMEALKRHFDSSSKHYRDAVAIFSKEGELVYSMTRSSFMDLPRAYTLLELEALCGPVLITLTLTDNGFKNIEE